jgi:hypothetical protein
MAIEEPKYAVSLHEGAYEVRDYSLISQGATTICASTAAWRPSATIPA